MKVVAVYASSPALTAILAAVLAAVPSLRVRHFDSQHALTTYMRLSPVDILVCDFDCEPDPADRLTRSLRSDPQIAQSDFAVIALTHSVEADLKQVAMASGIDEVIVKPMSPKYLLERVLARVRLQRFAPSVPAPRQVLPQGERRSATPANWGGNVISLFGDGPAPAS